MDLWASARTPDQAAHNFEQLGEELVKAREAYRQTKDYDEALFGQDFAAE